MREIKFRAWDVFEKKIVTDTVDCYASFLANGEVSNASVFGCELMQYTVLLDKHGVEIYEGDIISSTILSGDNQVNAISFEYGAFRIGLQPINVQKDIEVIGNIYENPELLR